MDFLHSTASFLSSNFYVVLLITVTVAIVIHYIVTYSHLTKLGIKGPRPLPLIGNVLDFGRRANIHISMDKMYKKYKSIFGLYFFNYPVFVVCDPEIISHILVKEFSKFQDRPSMGINLDEPYSSFLTAVRGERWRGIRGTISPAFTSGKLRQISYIMQNAVDIYIKKLDDAATKDEVFDCYKYSQALTLEIILSSAFGVKAETQTNPNDQLTLYAKNAMSPRSLQTLVLLIPVIGRKLARYVVASPWGLGMNDIIRVAKDIIKQRRGLEDNAESRVMDLLQLMMEAQSPDRKGYKLSDSEVVAQSALFLLAGYETSAITITMVMYLLARHPEIQQKVYKEIRNVIGDTKPENEHLQDLKYMDAVINETQRLYPAAAILSRSCNETCVIKGVTFEKGLSVMIPAYSLQRDERYFPNPEEFKPERFLPENRHTINEFTYMPFGLGPRNCVGLRFAQLEMKIALARVIQRFRLLCHSTTPNPPRMVTRIVLSPDEPVYLKVERREKYTDSEIY